MAESSSESVSAEQAIARLVEGNRRFVSGQPSAERNVDAAALARMAEGQAPFAVVLCCSDSRVAPEIVFDQGLGMLFVIRVAGNYADAVEAASAELAVSVFGSRLVVVLGHSRCAAIATTLRAIDEPNADLSPLIRSLVDRIRPEIESTCQDVSDAADRLDRGVRANVAANVANLLDRSPILRQENDSGAVRVVGAVYSLERGGVEFLDPIGSG